VVYKRFPDKMLKDTYTPQTLKLQILFLYLSLVILLPIVIWPHLTFVLFFSIIIFSLLILPFTIFAIKQDPAVGLLSPLFLLIRAASLGAGIMWGILHKHVK
jgi:hypothetical protein